MPGEKNTFNLPNGEAIASEMKSIFREQRLAILAWMDSMGFKSFGLPNAWPSWDSLRLGAADIAARVRRPMSDIWETFLDVHDPVTAGKIDAQALTLGREVNASTTGLLDRLLSGVKDLWNQGKISLADAIKRLRGGVVEEIKPMEGGRANRIGETEASRAYHLAATASAKSDGALGKKWETAEGACPFCLYIEENAPVVPIDQPFVITGTGVYDTIDDPPAHTLCRCSLTYIYIDANQDWSETLIDPVIPKPDISAEDAKLKAEAELQAGVKFVTPESAIGGDYVTVVVDVSRVDAAWKAQDTYIGQGGTGAAIGGRYENFQAFLARARTDGTAIEQPRAGLDMNGVITLGDGRHRFAVFRDEGQTMLPITVPKEEARKIRRKYGPKK
jgi:hypothetical protein